MHPQRSSATARLIARCTLLAADDPVRHSLVPAGAVAPLTATLAADGSGRWFPFMLRHGWTRAVLHALERMILPGIITHYLARKRWLEHMVQGALDDGCAQVVVLGAGFDTLAWRLHHARPGVKFFELDHPATQTPKQRALGAAANLTFLPIDLAVASPAAVLHACPGFSCDQPVLFIAEGLLMYFPEKRVVGLLRELTGLTRARTEVLFTFMAAAADGSITFRGESPAVSWWLRRRREPFQWGLAGPDLSGFLRAQGLRPTAVAAHAELRTQILTPLGLDRLPLAHGEGLCRCTTVSP